MKTLMTILLLSLTMTANAVDLDFGYSGETYSLDTYFGKDKIGVGATYQDDAYSLMLIKKHESILSNSDYMRIYAEYGVGAIHLKDLNETELATSFGAGLKWEINDTINIKTGYKYTLVDNPLVTGYGDAYFGLGLSF